MIRYYNYNPRKYSKEELAGLKQRFLGISGSIVLSTCQRFEVYTGSGYVPYTIVLHLFRVASGLESIFTGDPAIQGQVRKAYSEALIRTTCDRNMHRLFQRALHTGKQVRTLTGIADGAVNYPQATVNMLKSVLHNDFGKPLAIVGVNALTEAIIRILIKSGWSAISLYNRTWAHAERLSDEYALPCNSIEILGSKLPAHPVVITATSSASSLFYEANTPPVDLIFFDLAVPGDVDRKLMNRKNVKLFTLDDIEAGIDHTRNMRKAEIHKAEKIITEHVREFMLWQENAVRHQSTTETCKTIINATSI